MNDHHFITLANECRPDLLQTLRSESPHHPDMQLDGAAEPAVSLVHVHLPLLANAGVITYDAETGAVERGPNFDEIVGLLDSEAPDDK